MLYSGVPFGATAQDTSEFMIGDVAVSVVLLESDGTTDTSSENWSVAEINQVKSEISEGFQWWEDVFDLQGSSHDLNFTIDFTYADTPVQTSYEAISRSRTDEALWIDDFLDQVSYNTGASIFDDLDQWNHDRRIANNTDWAYTIFVVDSSADADGKFADDFFSYAYIGGPFMVTTYDNGGWGIGDMSKIIAHETGHIFYALDEHPGSGATYNSTGGYYNIQNLNAADNHPAPGSRVASIMAEASLINTAYSSLTSSPSSFEMLGWKDTDSDGIFDVLDIPLTLTGSGTFTSSTGIYSFSGQSDVQTLTNQNPLGTGDNLTTNSVDRIQYRIDGGSWIDGNTYGGHSEAVSQNASITGAGAHTIDFRTIVTETGLASNIWSDTVVISPGVTVTPASGLQTSEAGGMDTFDVVLDMQPTADVTISITSNDTTEGTVDLSSLTFTSSNWNVAQTVTVTGVDDSDSDGAVNYTIVTGAAVSTDSNYNGLNGQDVTVSNKDDEGPVPINVDFSGATVESYVTGQDQGGTATVEDAGATLHLTGNTWKKVALPYDVTVDTVLEFDFRSTTEGEIQGIGLDDQDTALDGTRVFELYGTSTFGVQDFRDYNTPGTWKHYVIPVGQHFTGQMQYLTFVNDHDVPTPTAEGQYSNIVIREANQPGFSVTPTVGLVTTEAGGAATFDVMLHTQPTADVTISIASDDTTEGTTDVSSLTFTSSNWNVAQTVTVTGVDDQLVDGDKVYSIVTGVAVSSDASYNGLGVSDVSVTNTNDDTVGISVTPTSGLVTTEAGGVATFDVVLQALPTADVTISIASSDTTEGTTDVSSLTFTAANWNVAQTVTVTGVNDLIDDGDVAFTIVTGAAISSDGTYNGQDASDVSVSNTDNDTAGITVTPTSGLVTTEIGSNATFDVVLDTQPTADVTISIASNDTTEGISDVSSLTFTSSNWNVVQTVTVTGVNDLIDDGDVAYTIVTGAVTSSDGAYNGLNATDVSVSNTDNDTAGITVTPTSGLVTTETGSTATFDVVLNTLPTADVTISIASNDTTEGTADVSSLTFTSSNWNVAQTVTVTGLNDLIDDGDIAYTIVTGAAGSSDGAYSGLNATDVSVSNTDNDTASITVTPTSGLVTTETGGAATFDVVLDTQPTADVTISIASNDTTEGTTNVSSLTFTSGNWNVAQTVTVTGADDASVDGNVAYTIVTGAATSSDGVYNGMNASDVTVSNTDNDTPGITVTPVNGLVTIESGSTAAFDVVLNTQPTGDVTISVASNDSTEGTTDVSSLTFTSSNWNVSQTVTVTGVDDSVDDGDIAYTIVTGVATSSDGGYNGLNVSDVSVSNTDNDAAGITVTPTSGLVTTETGSTATFDVVLDTQPAGIVTISIASDDSTEGAADVSSLTFTAGNWNVAQTVTVTGVNDLIDDGDVSYTVVTGAATSTDLGYDGLNVLDVAVSNTDNDTAGITVTPASGLVTTEVGSTATFDIVLDTQPTADVMISIASNDTTEGTVDLSSLIFTSSNWNVAQTVTVTGVNDLIDDGDVAYTIVTGAVTSSDGAYNGLNATDVSVSNTDNDTAGITVTPTSGLVTTETGSMATFDVVLDTQPTADVTISIASNDTTEGTADVSSLTFTSSNWNVAQTVTVTGVNDSVDDGDVSYAIVTGAAASSDGVYNGMNTSDVSISNTDNDTAGITVTPTSGLVTSEAGSTATFDVVLDTQPTADVTISIASNDTTEGTADVSSLTFTSSNWNVAQTVTVTGADDVSNDSDVAYAIVTGAATSSDGSYNGMNASDVSVLNTDNDIPGFTVTPASGLVTTEAGGVATFDVVLNTQPTADVTISVASDDTTEGTSDVSSLTFTSSNWNVAQTVTVTGANDSFDDGDVAYAIVTGIAASADTDYNGLNATDVTVSNIDDDTVGISLTPSFGLITTEVGGTATFDVVLDARPTADVAISIASNDTTEGTTDVSSVTFTSSNWNVAQTVIVTGENDSVDDGDVSYTVVTGAAVSADGSYNGLNAGGVAVSNTDDDTAGVTVTPTSGLVTTEAGSTATFDVVLDTQPTADVTISIASSDTTEGTADVSSLTFTSSNWNVAQTVTVTGVDDVVDEGDVSYTIVTGTVASSDSTYNGQSVIDVAVSNTDDDTAGITVTPTSGLVTAETGSTAMFDVVLDTKPTADVTISIASNDTTEGTTNVSSLTFTSSNWNVAQTVTVTGVDDLVDDGDVAYTIVTGGATSSDGVYNGLNASDVAVSNTDNDTAGITVTPTSGLVTNEAGGAATFDVVLDTQPTADVTISIASNDTTEGTADVSSLTFTSSNWNVSQTVTVTGADDLSSDGDIGYTIVTGAATSSDGVYNGMNASDVTVTNTDNDIPGFTLTPASGLVTTEAGGAATFDVVLNTQPTADVTISIGSDDTTEGTTDVSSLTFTSSNWNVAQTVTVTGANDSVDDGDVAYTILTGTAASADTDYNGLNAIDVAVSNTDDDTAGYTVTPTSGLVTTEAGGTATFDVELDTQPIADVTISIASGNTTEGTPDVSSLTFTSSNWNVAQTVTVTGADDSVDDGDVSYTIVTGAATSSDSKYNGLNGSDVSVSNTDNDTAGVTVTPTSGLVTTEAGSTATFDVVLDTQPTADVTISIASADTTEGTTDVSSLTFTSSNWNVAQTVTVTGVDDFVDEGDVSYTIVTGTVASSDSTYNGQSVIDVAVSNTDDDTAGITVTPTSGLVTTETGSTTTFDVVLDTQPIDKVIVSIVSSDITEGTTSVSSLKFTSSNWNVAQTVTVTGIDDLVDDGDVSYAIITGPAGGSDVTYSGLNASDVAVSNTDNDTAGITVTPTSGLVTNEAGGAATFDVVLDTQPTADVTISIASNDTTEGTADVSSLTFTSSNWNASQTVTVTGADDLSSDGDIGYTIVTGSATSSDGVYNGMNASDVTVTNTDNDIPGFTLTPASGLVTTEAGGAVTFDVVLNTQPTADVTISIASDDTTEGVTDVSSLTFTSSNWNVAQTVTVTGVNDSVDDGDVSYTVVTGTATSADTDYNGLNAIDVAVSNTDDDIAGYTVTPTSGLVTTEAGGTATFDVVLDTQPTADVTISVASDDTVEGTSDVSSLTFTSSNWNVAQTATVTGADDSVDDGDVSYTIVTGAATSSDSKYNGLNGSDVSVSNTDDDTAGVTVTPTSGLVTTEAGSTATFDVVLDTQPTADVTISIVSNDTTEGTADVSSLTFTSSNWNVAQTVTVTGADDLIDDSDQSYTIVTGAASSSDGPYNGLNVSDVTVSNTDDDTAGITVTPTNGLVTTEAGGTATFDIVLDTQPIDKVTISIVSSDATEGATQVSSLKFNSSNWNVAQTVTVTGVNDSVDDGDVSYSIITGPAGGSDAVYSGLNASDVAVSNTDNDTAGVSVTPTSGLVTNEAGGAATFDVVLDAQPTADVTISIASNDTTEGTTNVSSLTFTAANWNVVQAVTVTGVDELIDDGDVSYSIVTGAAVSSDGAYNGLNVSDVTVSNTDDDTAGITVNPTAGLVTTEFGKAATFDVVLDTQPTADVTITIASNDSTEGAADLASLTFTSSNWNVAQTVTVTGVDDGSPDGTISYSIVTGAATSSDAAYNGVDADDVSITNSDNETPGITVAPTSTFVTSEDGANATFEVELNTQPTADVTIDIISSDTSEGVPSTSTLTFTPTNWNVAQQVAVAGVDDVEIDGDVTYTIEVTPAVSADAAYNGLDGNDFSLTNLDDDVNQATNGGGGDAGDVEHLSASEAANLFSLWSTQSSGGDSSGSLELTSSDSNEQPRAVTLVSNVVGENSDGASEEVATEEGEEEVRMVDPQVEIQKTKPWALVGEGYSLTSHQPIGGIVNIA